MDTTLAAALAVYATGAVFHTIRVGRNLNNAEFQVLIRHRQVNPLEVAALSLACVLVWPLMDAITLFKKVTGRSDE